MSSHPLQSNEILIDVSLLNYRTTWMSETSYRVKTVTHLDQHWDSQVLSCMYLQAPIASEALFLYLSMNPIASTWPK